MSPVVSVCFAMIDESLWRSVHAIHHVPRGLERDRPKARERHLFLNHKVLTLEMLWQVVYDRGRGVTMDDRAVEHWISDELHGLVSPGIIPGLPRYAVYP
jgi:hypothetical protein